MVDSCHFRGPYDRAGGMAAGKHRHFTSSKVKITLPKKASDASSWRTMMSTDVTDILRATDLLGSAPPQTSKLSPRHPGRVPSAAVRSCSVPVIRATP